MIGVCYVPNLCVNYDHRCHHTPYSMCHAILKLIVSDRWGGGGGGDCSQHECWKETYNPKVLSVEFPLIRESVDSLCTCRDGAETPMPPYIGKAFTRTNFEDLSLFRYMIMVCE